MASGLASWGRFFSVVASAFGHVDLLDFGLVSVTHLALQSLEHWYNDIMSSAFAVAPAGVAVYDLRKRRVPGSD
jgi:hypothetical protein